MAGFGIGADNNAGNMMPGMGALDPAPEPEMFDASLGGGMAGGDTSIDVAYGSQDDPAFWQAKHANLPVRAQRRVELYRMLNVARQAKATEMRVRDVDALDLIRQDRQESQKRLASLMEKLSSVEQKLAEPPPEVNPRMEMDTPEMLAAAFASVLNPRAADKILSTTYGLAGERMGLEHKNAMGAYDARRDAAGREYQMIGRAADREQDSLDRGRTDELNYIIQENRLRAQQEMDEARQLAAEGKQRDANAKALRATFFAADSAQEVQYAARLLQEQFPEYALTPEEISKRVREMGSKSVRDLNDRIMSHAKAYGTIDPASQMQFESARAALVNDYGVDPSMVVIPTAETLAKQKMDEQKRQHEARLQLAKDRFNWVKNVQHANIMAARWASIETAQFNATLAAERNDLGTMRYFIEQMDSSSKDVIKEAERNIRKLRADIAGKKASHLKVTNSRDRREIEQTITGLEAELAQWTSTLEEQRGTRAGVGLPPDVVFDGAQATSGSRGGSTRGGGNRPKPMANAAPKSWGGGGIRPGQSTKIGDVTVTRSK